MSKSVKYLLLILLTLAALPFAFIARTRSLKSPETRLHVIWDMDQQEKYHPQGSSPLFADGRAMRAPVPGTVARGELMEDDHLYRGQVGTEWAKVFPLEVTPQLLQRGRERFNVFCSPCHGLAGYGDGMVAKRATAIGAGRWIPPASLQDELVRSRPVGHLFNTITNGIRNMPAYGPQIPPHDRWAIVAYLRALQRSQHASLSDVPYDEREELRQ